MEDSRECAAANTGRTTVRIAWTPSCVQSLLELAREVEGLKGREKERVLQERWLERHPTLPSLGRALVQQLYRKRMEPEAAAAGGHPTD